MNHKNSTHDPFRREPGSGQRFEAIPSLGAESQDSNWTEQLWNDLNIADEWDEEWSAATDRQLLEQNLTGFRILNVLGRGGQGVVFEAHQKSTDRRVAIKLLSEKARTSGPARKRFDREFELICGLRHPLIVSLLDRGTIEDRPYLTMDVIHGIPIHDHQLVERLDVHDLLSLFKKVCDAVAFAHQRGIIHRDLKPQNILIDNDGTPHLLDFGLAKLVDQGSGTEALTLSGHIMGTVHYMAPEQLGGDDGEVDTRTDVYALGVTLYELLTGESPYPVFPDYAKTAQSILQQPPKGLRKVSSEHGEWACRDLDRFLPELDAILQRALAKAKSDRYGSASALGDDLQSCLDGGVVSALAHRRGYLLRKTLKKYWIPASVVAVALAAITASAGLTGWYAQEFHHQRDAARQIGKAAHQQFRTVFDRIMPMVSSVAAPGAIDQQLLVELSEAHGKLQAIVGDDEQMPDLAALISEEQGDLARVSGDLVSAAAHYETMLKILDESAPGAIDDDAIIAMRIRGLRKSAMVSEASLTPLVESLAVTNVLEGWQLNLAIVAEVVDSHLDLARAYRDASRLRDAAAHLATAFELLKYLPTDEKNSEPWLVRQAQAHYQNGETLKSLHQAVPARDEIAKAVETLNQQVQLNPSNVDYRYQLACALHALGFLAAGGDDVPLAISYYADALAKFRDLCTYYPAVVQWRREMCVLLDRFAAIKIRTEEFNEAALLLHESSELLDSLDNSLVSTEWKRMKIRHLVQKGRLLREQDNDDEAISYFDAALALATNLEVSLDPESKNLAAFACGHLAKSLRRAGQLEESLRVAQLGFSWCEELISAEPEVYVWHRESIYSCIHVASSYMAFKSTEKDRIALEYFDLAQSRLDQLIADGPVRDRHFADSVTNAIADNRKIIAARNVRDRYSGSSSSGSTGSSSPSSSGSDSPTKRNVNVSPAAGVQGEEPVSEAPRRS